MFEIKCSICYDTIDRNEKGNIIWHTGKYGACEKCIKHFRQSKINPKKIKKDSYNYLTSTIRQKLSRNGFLISERTTGSLKNEDFLIWSILGVSANNYKIKYRAEIKKLDNEFLYTWTMTTYDDQDHLLKDTNFEKTNPNVLLIKELLDEFLNTLKIDSFEYFLALSKQILDRHKFTILKQEQIDGGTSLKGEYREFTYEMILDPKKTWSIKIYHASGELYCDHTWGSFAVPPIKEFFNKLESEFA
jgi:hypothetical protein